MENETKLLNRIGIMVGLPKCYCWGCKKVAIYSVSFKAVKPHPPWSGSPANTLSYCSEHANIWRRHKRGVAKIEAIDYSVAIHPTGVSLGAD
jgi:hypothetical protein